MEMRDIAVAWVLQCFKEMGLQKNVPWAAGDSVYSYREILTIPP